MSVSHEHRAPSTEPAAAKVDPNLLLLVHAIATAGGRRECGNPVLFALRAHGAHCVGELVIDINR